MGGERVGDLREKLIEAVAGQLAKIEFTGVPEVPKRSERIEPHHRKSAERLLGAVLDTLEANAEEWERLYDPDLYERARYVIEEGCVRDIAERLVEVLREGGG